MNVNFDFTTDSPAFWERFWEREDGRGVAGSDPDNSSKTLKTYHQKLWSKPLPNGSVMTLTAESGPEYLTWKSFRFGSDSITASFRYKGYKRILDLVAVSVPDYRLFVEDYLRRFYTIGGAIIFPKRLGGINQARGCNQYIRDRWDLTMECIRRFYADQDSPLYSTLKDDDKYFSLFVDYKGFVDFFFLQDCVSEDYSEIVFWEGDGRFRKNPFPETVEEYLNWIDNEKEFVCKRNRRIKDYLEKEE